MASGVAGYTEHLNVEPGAGAPSLTAPMAGAVASYSYSMVLEQPSTPAATERARAAAAPAAAFNYGPLHPELYGAPAAQSFTNYVSVDRPPPQPEHISTSNVTDSVKSIRAIPDAYLSAQGDGWNERFQRILDMPADNAEAALLRIGRIYVLSQEFAQAAQALVKIIINEGALPDEQKTIKPINAGGVAGGKKYLTNGIFFKFAVDEHQLYGGEEFAMKAAANEMTGLLSYLKCDLRELHVPLMALCDYQGQRVIAISQLPISGDNSLVYGSCNQGATVVAKIPKYNTIMEEAANKLNLKAHFAGPIGQQVLVHAPADIEGHVGTDGRFYVIDCARLFPPEYPLIVASATLIPVNRSSQHVEIVIANYEEEIKGFLGANCIFQVFGEVFLFSQNRGELNKQASNLVNYPIQGDAMAIVGLRGAVLYSLLRPELVKSNPKPLSSDALTGFGLDRCGEHNAEVRDATERLRKRVNEYVEELKENGAYPFSAASIIKSMHDRGINSRYLGALRCQFQGDVGVGICLLREMCSRAIAGQLHSLLRQTSGEATRRTMALQFLNTVFGQSPASMDYWTLTIKTRLHIKFGLHGNPILPEEQSPTYDLRKVIAIPLLFREIAPHLGMEFTETFHLRVVANADHVFSAAQPFTQEEFKEFVVIVRSIVPESTVYEYLERYLEAEHSARLIPYKLTPQTPQDVYAVARARLESRQSHLEEIFRDKAALAILYEEAELLVHSGRLDAADRILRKAQACLQAQKVVPLELAVGVYFLIGVVHLQRAQCPEAEACFLRCVAVLRRVIKDDSHPLNIMIMSRLCLAVSCLLDAKQQCDYSKISTTIYRLWERHGGMISLEQCRHIFGHSYPPAELLMLSYRRDAVVRNLPQETIAETTKRDQTVELIYENLSFLNGASGLLVHPSVTDIEVVDKLGLYEITRNERFNSASQVILPPRGSVAPGPPLSAPRREGACDKCSYSTTLANVCQGCLNTLTMPNPWGRMNGAWRGNSEVIAMTVRHTAFKGDSNFFFAQMKDPIQKAGYVEVSFLDVLPQQAIFIGLAGEAHPINRVPGHDAASCGLDIASGLFFAGGGREQLTTKFAKLGETYGFGLSSSADGIMRLRITRNGEFVALRELPPEMGRMPLYVTLNCDFQPYNRQCEVQFRVGLNYGWKPFVATNEQSRNLDSVRMSTTGDCDFCLAGDVAVAGLCNGCEAKLQAEATEPGVVRCQNCGFVVRGESSQCFSCGGVELCRHCAFTVHDPTHVIVQNNVINMIQGPQNVHGNHSCDTCKTRDWRSGRWVCSVCPDYDICETCLNTGRTTLQHTTAHATMKVQARPWASSKRIIKRVAQVTYPDARHIPSCSVCETSGAGVIQCNFCKGSVCTTCFAVPELSHLCVGRNSSEYAFKPFPRRCPTIRDTEPTVLRNTWRCGKCNTFRHQDDIEFREPGSDSSICGDCIMPKSSISTEQTLGAYNGMWSRTRSEGAYHMLYAHDILRMTAVWDETPRDGNKCVVLAGEWYGAGRSSGGGSTFDDYAIPVTGFINLDVRAVFCGSGSIVALTESEVYLVSENKQLIGQASVLQTATTEKAMEVAKQAPIGYPLLLRTLTNRKVVDVTFWTDRMRHRQFARCASGHVYSWGDNAEGALGHGDTTDRTTPSLIQSIASREHIIKVASASTTTLFVTASHNLLAAGRHDRMVSEGGSLIPKPLEIMATALDVVPTLRETFVILGTDGHVYRLMREFHSDPLLQLLSAPVHYRDVYFAKICAHGAIDTLGRYHAHYYMSPNSNTPMSGEPQCQQFLCLVDPIGSANLKFVDVHSNDRATFLLTDDGCVYYTGEWCYSQKTPLLQRLRVAPGQVFNMSAGRRHIAMVLGGGAPPALPTYQYTPRKPMRITPVPAELNFRSGEKVLPMVVELDLKPYVPSVTAVFVRSMAGAVLARSSTLWPDQNDKMKPKIEMPRVPPGTYQIALHAWGYDVCLSSIIINHVKDADIAPRPKPALKPEPQTVEIYEQERRIDVRPTQSSAPTPAPIAKPAPSPAAAASMPPTPPTPGSVVIGANVVIGAGVQGPQAGIPLLPNGKPSPRAPVEASKPPVVAPDSLAARMAAATQEVQNISAAVTTVIQMVAMSKQPPEVRAQITSVLSVELGERIREIMTKAAQIDDICFWKSDFTAIHSLSTLPEVLSVELGERIREIMTKAAQM